MKAPATKTRIEPPDVLFRYQPYIQAALQQCLSEQTEPLYNIHRYCLGWTDTEGTPQEHEKGKALRPTLAMLACEAVAGDFQRALPVATAIELVHNFSLIHDDLQDGDVYRHHRPTAWAIWGKGKAIIAGVAMLKIADKVADNLTSIGIKPNVAVEIQRELTHAYLRMMEGQYLDIKFESLPSVTVQQYLHMIRQKTGALIEVSILAGALSGIKDSTDRTLCQGLSAVGHEIGKVFQIKDDILGVWGGIGTGKPVGADIKRKKKALPAVHALNNAKGADAKRIHQVFATPELGKPEIDDVLYIMNCLDTRKWCQNLAEEHWNTGLHVLNSLSIGNEIRQDFEALGEFLLVRET